MVWFEVRMNYLHPEIGVQRDEGKLLDLATTPALRATPPVPGGEPESQPRPLPENATAPRLNDASASTPSEDFANANLDRCAYS